MAKKEEVNTAIDEINQILSESSASNKLIYIYLKNIEY